MGRSAVWTITILFALIAVPCPGDRGLDLDPDRVDWRSLRYEASKLFVTATASAELTAAPQRDDWRLVLESEALGRRSVTRLDFDPVSATPSIEERLKIKSDAELRSFHYGPTAAVRVRYHAEPKAHAGRPLAEWREKSRQEQSYGDPERASAVTAPASLLYVLSASSLASTGDRLTIPVFTKGRLVSAVAEVVGVADAGAVPLDGGEATDATWPALRIRVGGRAADGGEVDLDLFGLDGDLEILLDRRHRLPLSIRGKMSVVGDVDVRLLSATLAR